MLTICGIEIGFYKHISKKELLYPALKRIRLYLEIKLLLIYEFYRKGQKSVANDDDEEEGLREILDILVNIFSSDIINLSL